MSDICFIEDVSGCTVLEIEAVCDEDISFIEKCIQGPEGPAGAQGPIGPEGGSQNFTTAVPTGQTLTLTSIPLATYTACNFQVSVKDLVNNKEKIHHLDYSFFNIADVKSRKSSIRTPVAQHIASVFSHTTDATNFNLLLQNNTPNTLVVTGIEKPIFRT